MLEENLTIPVSFRVCETMFSFFLASLVLVVAAVSTRHPLSNVAQSQCRGMFVSDQR